MLTKIIALAASALALFAVPSDASTPQFGCETTPLIHDGSPSFTYRAVLAGYAVSDVPGEGVSIRCYIEVNGSEYPGATTNLGAGTQAAVTSGPVTFTVDDGDIVELCAAWTAGPDSDSQCFFTQVAQVPPQEVIDLANDAFDLATDLLCIALNVAYAGVPGVVEIRPGGDVYVLGSQVINC